MESTFVDRVRSLGWLDGQYVIIAGGVLDVLGLRKAADIDAVVSKDLFEQLVADGWELSEKHGEQYVVSDDVEAWLSWDGPHGPLYLDDLEKQAIDIEGVLFCSPEAVLEWKQRHNRPKDAADIQLLEEYLHGKN